MSHDLTFIHRFVPGTRREVAPVLLLHGTGGDENDLIPFGQAIAPGAPLLSVRGKVLENGMPRFFRRLAEGIFDEADVRQRAEELADFVTEARARYNLTAPLALGYSNGANIAAALLMMRTDVLAGALLFRAMVPLRDAPALDLAGKPVVIVSGALDPIAPPENAARLVAMLRQRHADVRHVELPVGHALSQADINAGREWVTAHDTSGAAA